MAEKKAGQEQRVPYAELVVRPMDARPIVVTIEELGAEVTFSPGTHADSVLTYVVLHLMAAAARSVGIVRILKEDNAVAADQGSFGGDDIPF